jgi:UDP-3-O-[3-hydroxymyristoyl] glucosamine N-acyltransferase
MGQAGVVGTIEGNKVYMGTPAEDAGVKRREFVWIRRIPELWNKVMQSH